MRSENLYPTVVDKFEHLFNVMTSDRFLNRQGLGNEVPFFICPYAPKDSIEMEAGIDKYLTKRLRLEKNIDIIHLNLYDLSIEILQEQDNVWDEIIGNEDSLERDEIFEVLQNSLNAEEFLIPKIAQKIEGKKFDIFFLSGVGAVYPYIRSHTVLNNLQSTIKDKPTVLFFPGEYSYSESKGRSLNLFGLFEDDQYYRAFNIFDYQI